MNNHSHSTPSSSTEGLARVPCVIHHRDGGYLCLEPKSDARESAAVASDRDIIPYKKYFLQPKGCTPAMSPNDGRQKIRTKTDFFIALDQLVGKEVAIKDVETQKYLTSEQGFHGRLGKPDAQFKENAQFFHIDRTNTGAHYFRTGDPRRHLYLRKSSKTKNWVMKGLSGRTVDIDTSQVNFRTVDKKSNANDWIIEPDDGVVILDSLPTGEGENHHGKILFLGIVDTNSTDEDLEVSYHFRNVPAAWRTREQWDRAIDSMKKQHTRGFEYSIHTDCVGRKTKWIAKFVPDRKICVVISSSNFHQEHLEDCLDKMEDLMVLGHPTGKKLGELGLQTQAEEVQSTEKDNTKLREKEKASGVVSAFQPIKDVPVFRLPRCKLHTHPLKLEDRTMLLEEEVTNLENWLRLDAGRPFSLQKAGSEPDLLYLESIQEEQGKENNSNDNEIIKTISYYFGELNKCSKYALENKRGQYLCCRDTTI